jgi:hypothetical protein
MKDALQEAVATLENIRDYFIENDPVLAAVHFKTIASLTLMVIKFNNETTLREQSAAKDKLWRQYSQDFDLMTDEEIDQHTKFCIEDKHDAECWLDAVASWEAAGRPRSET